MTAFICVVSFCSPSARLAPESTHDVSGLKRLTLVFDALPPIITAWESDHGRRIGLIAGGAAD
jgi:hypothetical protein